MQIEKSEGNDKNLGWKLRGVAENGNKIETDEGLDKGDLNIGRISV